MDYRVVAARRGDLPQVAVASCSTKPSYPQQVYFFCWPSRPQVTLSGLAAAVEFLEPYMMAPVKDDTQPSNDTPALLQNGVGHGSSISLSP